MDVLFAQAVFITFFDKVLARIDHKNTFASYRIFFVDNNNAGGDACAIEQVGR
jgi:hypothetical protein